MERVESGLSGINPPGKGAGRPAHQGGGGVRSGAGRLLEAPRVNPAIDNIRHLTAHMATGGATAKCAKPLEKSGVTIIVTG